MAEKPKGSNLETGYRSVVGVGYNVGVDFMGIDRAMLNLANPPHLFLGLGVGGRMYYESNMTYSIFIIPVFIDARYDTLNHHDSSFISMGAGNLFRVSPGSAVEGTYLSPTIGVRYNSKK